jgi:deoxyribonuclease II
MQVSALNDNGHPVDWWFLYKVPKLTQNAESQSTVGYEYVYFDPTSSAVAKSSHLLTDGKGALDLTLQSVFQHAATTTGWILYNDQMPAGAKRPDNSAFGHTKGVIAYDTSSGSAFWLLHSWPQYAIPTRSALPTPMFGQTFLCMTLDSATASKIATQMLSFQEPQSYLPRIPASLKKTDPLYLLTQPFNPRATPGGSNVLNCKTHGGQAFKVIAKNRNWGKDFWNDLVGPTLKASMDDETWIRGPIPPIIDSDGIHKTFDIKFINLAPLGAPWAWPETHDHAKWGITTTSDWICVGDINRMISQENRGGGTIALQNKTLWSALSKTDLLVAPPGFSVAEARSVIRSTHKEN